ncbi:hypothetical protein NIES2135_66090 (plasmid) [Leptolyngbya boryana NIES-2135]|jgi:hypothetical protein|uniref:Uncharacterized protein n=1 Tax=Leptolyngbya boryana NIES-2135 TaxID=1973484 RepID=A0A1Z4JSN0_LEPBY|nr:hypothetical protein NIES2135_66090 [Leptolyngbya boryana NIES-2135]
MQKNRDNSVHEELLTKRLMTLSEQPVSRLGLAS